MCSDSIVPMIVGETWAYGTSDTPYYFLQVKVIKIEEKHVVVASVDEDGVEGHRTRIPRRNLRVLWDDRWEFLRDARIEKADREAEDDAATYVFDELIPADDAWFYRGSLSVDRVEEVAKITGLTVEQLSSSSMDGYQVARAAVALHPNDVLRKLDREEHADRWRSVREAMNSDHNWWYMSDSERIERIVAESGRLTERRNAVLRMWAGEPAMDLLKQNSDLRLELLTARQVATSAIDALSSMARAKKAVQFAESLRAQLGEFEEEAKPADVADRLE